MAVDPQKEGRKFEAEFAKRIGGTLQKGSGNVWYCKLDVKDVQVLWSLKWTKKHSFSLHEGLMQEVEAAINGGGGIGGETVPAIATSLDGEVFVTLRAEDFIRLFTSDVKWLQPTKAEQKRRASQIPSILKEEPDAGN